MSSSIASDARLTADLAERFAAIALGHVTREFPHKADHVFTGLQDIGPHRTHHPIFFGSFDWHSCVHGYWTLATLLRRFPDMPSAPAVRALFATSLTPSKVAVELDYLSRPMSTGFERPYGWGWLLKLATELHTWDDPDARTWSANLKPLAEVIAGRYIAFFPKQTYPIRSGVHSNTAFGLALAHDYAAAVGDKKLRAAVEERAKKYYGKDEDAPARWEPDGADFLSPSLCEADLMRRVLPAKEFREWLVKYLPGLAEEKPATLFTPATVTDRTDGHLVHLDGLNLSRAWCMKGIAAALPADDAMRKPLLAAATKHADAGLKQVASGDYAGEHWLASFAVLMLSAE